MSREKTVRMANQIATFFQSQSADQHVTGVAAHINSFWDPRMRTELLGIIEQGGEGLCEQVLAAADMIKRPDPARSGKSD